MILSPSLFAANAGSLNSEIEQIETAGAEWLHIDVMDGLFVPNLSFGPNIVRGIRKSSKLFFDVHLMLQEPERFVPIFIKEGADSITVHYEATNALGEIYKLCNQNSLKFGIAISPNTPVSVIAPWVDKMDLLLIMSIYPGIEGQSFMPEALIKISEAKRLRKQTSADFLISVDGGVNPKTAVLCRNAGADVLVAGGSVFKATDRKAALELLRS